MRNLYFGKVTYRFLFRFKSNAPYVRAALFRKITYHQTYQIFYCFFNTVILKLLRVHRQGVLANLNFALLCKPLKLAPSFELSPFDSLRSIPFFWGNKIVLV